MDLRRIAIVGGECARAKDLVQAWMAQYPSDIVLHLDDADQLLVNGAANYRSAPIDRDDDADMQDMLDLFDPHVMLLCGTLRKAGDRTRKFCGQWRRLARQRGLRDKAGTGFFGDDDIVWSAGVADGVLSAVIRSSQLGGFMSRSQA